MIEQIAGNMAKKLCALTDTKEQTKEDIEVVQYGIECFINIAFPILIIGIVAIIKDQLLEMILWLLSFLLLRNYIGGYHASSHMKCIFFSCVLGISAIFSFTLLPSISLQVKIISCILFLLGNVIAGPILQESYGEMETKKRKQKAIFFLFEYVMVFSFIEINVQISNSIFIGIVSAELLYLIKRLPLKPSHPL